MQGKLHAACLYPYNLFTFRKPHVRLDSYAQSMKYIVLRRSGASLHLVSWLSPVMNDGNPMRSGNKANMMLGCLQYYLHWIFFSSSDHLELRSPTMDEINEPSRPQVMISDIHLNRSTHMFMHRGGEWFLFLCTTKCCDVQQCTKLREDMHI